MANLTRTGYILKKNVGILNFLNLLSLIVEAVVVVMVVVVMVIVVLVVLVVVIVVAEEIYWHAISVYCRRYRYTGLTQISMSCCIVLDNSKNISVCILSIHSYMLDCFK